MKNKILFLYGGRSTESDISIISAVQAMNNMNKEKYDVIPVFLDKDGSFYTSEKLFDMNTYKDMNLLKKECKEVIITKKNNEFVLLQKKFPNLVVEKFDFVFPVMHGYNTEDGVIAGFLETLNCPYAESDIYASVIGQDKVFQKVVLKDAGIPVVDYVYFYEIDYNNDPKEVIKQIGKLNFPVIVKPARQGSSVGISVAKNKNELIEAIEDALLYDNKILVEKVIPNLKELNCSVLGAEGIYEASVIEEVFKSKDLLSFEDKYLSSNKSKGMASLGRKIPASITDEETKLVEDLSIRACKALDSCGVVRIDYLMDTQTNEIYLNEMNMTPGSLAFYLWDKKDVKYSKLLEKIINLGIKRYQNKSKKTVSFETTVLSGFNGSKGIKK